MQFKNKKIIVKSVLFMLFILTVGFLLIFFVIKTMFDKPSAKKIINIFSNNQLIFEKSVFELENIEYDYVTLDNFDGILTIKIYSNDGVTSVAEENYSLYDNSIDLLNKLNLRKIIKKDNNVIFLFNIFGQTIAYVKNEKYISSSEIEKTFCIKDKWYYVQESV